METCSIVHSPEAPQAEALSEHQVKSTPTPCCGHEVRPLSYSPRLLKGHKLNYRATRDCERHLFQAFGVIHEFPEDKELIDSDSELLVELAQSKTAW